MARKRLQRTVAPLYPEHPESEHKWRIDRARRMMREDNLDALLLARNVNVFYASGSRFVFVSKDAPSALGPQSTAIITPEADVYCQRFGPFDTDDVALHTTCSESLEFYDDELELVNILRDYGIGSGDRIGTEWGPGLCVGINPIKFLTLKERLSDELGAGIINGIPTIWKTMGVKSALEIERMRVAVAAAARAMDRILDYIEIGMNELDVARQASIFMLEEGADTVRNVQVMSRGEDLRFGSCRALDKPVQKGWVNLDMGCTYKRYSSDINRGVFLGREPTRGERKLYECRLGVNELLDERIKPGVAMDDVITAMKEYVQEAGCVLQKNHGHYFGGHGIGLENHQPPGFAPSEAQPDFQNEEGKVLFEPGMMFTYEMPITLPGLDAFFNIEDDVVVTDTGLENMSSMITREPRVKL